MKYIIKRIIIGVGIALILTFINNTIANAATVNVTLPTPSTFGEYQNCGTSSCTPVAQWPAQTSAVYNGMYTSQWIGVSMLSYGYVRYDFGSPSYCDGQNISISGTVQSRNGQNVVTVAKAFLNSTSNVVDCSLNGSYWTCTGKGGGYFSLYFEFSTGVSTDILVSRSASVMCDATLNDLIQQQNNNTSSIINNQNQNTNSIINNQNQNTTIINNSINETNDFLKDTSSPNVSEYDFSSNNAQNGVITELITMPINLVRSFLNGFNSSCQPFVLGNLLGTNLTLPCINPGQHLGVIWNMIDVIISGLFIYVFGKKCVKIFNDITNMKENQIDEVFD